MKHKSISKHNHGTHWCPNGCGKKAVCINSYYGTYECELCKGIFNTKNLNNIKEGELKV